MTSLKIILKGKQRHILCFALSLLATCLTIQAQETAQDTLSITISQADKMFLEQNLDLLAQHYNIESEKALVQQAKLWDDPTLITDQNIYANNKWLEHGTNPDGSPKGQYLIQLEQLIRTAGKRRKLVDMAKTNVHINEWQFSQVMQNLKFELHTSFYRIAQLLAVQQLYQQQSIQLDKLRDGMAAQLKTGNIAQKDLLRIEALQTALKQDITEMQVQLENNTAELKTLLGISNNVFIWPLTESDDKKATAAMQLSDLIDSARANNAAFQLEQNQLQYLQQNYTYQKALAVPDITITPSYDHNSNYTPRYLGLGIALPIPLFNANKGNIRAAQWQVKQQESTSSQAAIKLGNNVSAAYNNYQRQLKLNTNTGVQFFDEYAKLYENISESFRQRRISMLEFIDYFNDYKEVSIRKIQQKLNLRLAEEELNLQTGTSIF